MNTKTKPAAPGSAGTPGPTPGPDKTERYIGRMLFDTGIPEGKADEMARRIVRRVRRDAARALLQAGAKEGADDR